MGLFGNMFSGISNAASGLFGGSGGAVDTVPREVLPSDGANLFRGEIETSRPPELFDGAGKPIPPAALTNDGLGHVYTFESLWNASNKSYSWRWDEAYKRSQKDACAMRRDCFLQGLLEERILPTSQMGWHIEPDDKKDPEQAREADYLTACVKAMPNFQRMTYCLLNEGVWAGRSGSMLQWDWQDVQSERSFIPTQSNPVNGDKLQFTWDGIPEIMIYSSISNQLEAEGCEIRITDRWRVAVFSRPEWRDRLIIYKHICVDADFFESEMHGGVHGVGVRHFVYWADFIRKEVGSYLLDFMQRVGSGFNVYYYDPSNPQAQSEAITIAKTQGRNTWIVWPRSPGDKGATKGVDRIEPGTGNADVLRNMMEYHDDKVERYIVGQTMSGGSDNESGLGGSGRAKFAESTKNNLVKGDCNRVEEAYTRDLVRPIQKYNRPQSKFRHRFVFDIETDDPKEKLAAVKSAWEIGVSFDEDEVRALTGMSKPSADAKILKNPQLEQAAAQAQGQPGQQSGANGDGASLFGGQPKQGVFEGKPAVANGNGNGVAKDAANDSNGHQLFGKPKIEKQEGPPARYEKKVGEFKEDEHPRDESGEFTSGGGGTATKESSPKTNKKVEAKPAKKPAKPKADGPGSQMAPEVREKLKEIGMVGTFPPAGVVQEGPFKGQEAAFNIKTNDLSRGAEALKHEALMSWDQRTKNGRISRQYRYTKEFMENNADEKHERVAAIEPHIEKIKDGLEASMNDDTLTHRKREAAAIANVIRETGLRPTDGAESVEHGHYGMSSLLAKHLQVRGDEIHVAFRGKEGVINRTVIRDPANVAFLKAAQGAHRGNESIFAEANSKDAGDVLKKLSTDSGGPKDIKIKDLRTLKAHQLGRQAAANFQGPPPPLTGDKNKDVKAIQSAILKMSGEVSKVLNNEPEQARDTYIHPEIFRQWQSKLMAQS